MPQPNQTNQSPIRWDTVIKFPQGMDPFRQRVQQIMQQSQQHGQQPQQMQQQTPPQQPQQPQRQTMMQQPGATGPFIPISLLLRHLLPDMRQTMNALARYENAKRDRGRSELSEQAEQILEARRRL